MQVLEANLQFCCALSEGCSFLQQSPLPSPPCTKYFGTQAFSTGQAYSSPYFPSLLAV